MFRWREIEEEGERAARPYVRSVSGNTEEKEKKIHSRKTVSAWIDGANKKFLENATASFSFNLTGPKEKIKRIHLYNTAMFPFVFWRRNK
jgi:hypothetical protein